MTKLVSFKDFKPVLEAVPQHLMDRADNDFYHGGGLDDETREHVDKVLGGKSHTIIDLDHSQQAADPDVEEHLEKHGYKIHDYKAGIASTEKMVGKPEAGIPMQKKVFKEKIGGVLEKTGAPDYVKNAFANDPARAVAKSTGLKILISHHPYATIGKTSGTNWAGESCMNAETGGHRHYLGADSEHLTHEAFLVPHDDESVKQDRAWPENPIARISLKRFDSGSGHTIFRPETTAYGAAGSAFHEAVHAWADQHHPGHPGEEYEIHPDLYADSDHTHTPMSDEDVKGIHNSGARTVTLNTPHIHMAIDSAIEHANNTQPTGKLTQQQAVNLSSIDNLGSSHLNKIINNSQEPNSTAASLAVRHGAKMSTSAINRVVDVGRGHFPVGILQNKRTPEHVFDKLDYQDLEKVPSERITPERAQKMVDAYVNEKSGSAYPLTKHKDKFSSEQVGQLVDREIEKRDISPAIYTAKNFGKEHADKIGDVFSSLKSSSQNGILSSANHIPQGVATTALHAHAILSNPNATEHDGKEAISILKNTQNNIGKAQHRGSNAIALPKGSNRHFTDDDVSDLADEGVYRSDDKELSKRFADAHIAKAKTAQNEFMKYHHKPEGFDTEDEYFENDKEALGDKINDAYAVAAHHAKLHGDEGHAEEHKAAFDNMYDHFDQGTRNMDYNEQKAHDMQRHFSHPRDFMHDIGEKDIGDELEAHHNRIDESVQESTMTTEQTKSPRLLTFKQFLESQIEEMSNEKLAQYKTAAAKDASDSDKAGKFKRADKRFYGIVKATKKQFKNDIKSQSK